MSESVNSEDMFKVPFTVTDNVEGEASQPISEKSEIISKTDPSQNTDVDSKIKDDNKGKSRLNVELPYKEPEWSGHPPSLFSFEIIKNGIFVETYNIQTSVVVFGRLDICDIVFEHPSVSRYHAIVQYCTGNSDHPKGFYLYDLGSTHGTFLNKVKVTPKVYYKLKVGYVVKFGGSTRLHIFQGPEEEEEPKVPVSNDEGCSWGMGEDAVEEDDDLSVNPFALSTPNEELYLEDPKKTLRGWFEREGYDLQYDVEEKGFATFVCRVQLPIDNNSGDFMPVEATVSGKKKEAVIACALEACRTLDRLGLLRQSHQESRQRKKKQWEENDYYDSDEDTFLDRTGTIEKKREMRKRMEKKSQAETFQSLEAKLNQVKNEIAEISSKLSVSKVNVEQENQDGDSLENFMANLSDTNNCVDKIEQRKMRFRLAEIEKEKKRLEKLLEIARPTRLPPIAKHPGMIGKRMKSKLKLPISKTKEIEHPKTTGVKIDDEEIEEDSDDEIKSDDTYAISNETKPSPGCSVSSVNNQKEIKSNYGLKLKEDIKQENIIKLSVEDENSTNKISPESSMIKKRSIGPDKCRDLENNKECQIKVKPNNKKVKKDNLTKLDVDVYETESTKYSTWMPPSGQSGDGITHLNAKYGY